MEINIGDLVVMKKEHPCKNNIFKVLRVGMDIKIRCEKCGREILISRTKFLKQLKNISGQN